MSNFIEEMAACETVDALNLVRMRAYETIDDSAELASFNREYAKHKNHIVTVLVPSKMIPLMFTDLPVTRRRVPLGADTDAYIDDNTGNVVVCIPEVCLYQNTKIAEKTGIFITGEQLGIRL